MSPAVKVPEAVLERFLNVARCQPDTGDASLERALEADGNSHVRDVGPRVPR